MTEQEFLIYRAELEVYLEVDKKFGKFMGDGKYVNWKSEEEFKERMIRSRQKEHRHQQTAKV